MDNRDDYGVAKGSAPARNEPVRHHDTLFALLARTLPSSGDSLGRVPNSLGCGRLGPQHRLFGWKCHIVITGRAVQQDIADLAATTIYTVNRVLSANERRGILTKKRGRIVLFRTLQ